ncbi:efflux RND transporter periplasmic adaptor subunit [Endozoicomonas sp. SCSIO W0465]|uniref:efflux RND transporter periplasmic adaptor subunit n=1 Tax=Endozoicomonas sp. SCSIO W0465 TaxID=2918516 RepID=UPI0020761870|nr:efflux RND transporter periplasmic adaptor subunit [Endozoicomonas sp. SCSIO W0465]USE38300.1 efflux RND transporter periplasmic adaptor subunit [Endozoicomonas sp. SCSIO W0465]
MNFRRWCITLVVSLSIVAGLACFKVLQIRSALAFAESFPEHSETVDYQEVALVEYTPEVHVLGEVVSPQRVELMNELPGRIVKVGFASDSEVQQGQLLLQLDTSEERAQLKSAVARAELASLAFQRIVNLRNTNAASQSQLDEAKSELSIANADIDALKSTIQKKNILAPFSGRVGIHQLEVGNFLQGSTAITTLVGNPGFIWVDFNLPQFYRDVVVGSPVRIRLLHNTANGADAGAGVGAGVRELNGKVVALDTTLSASSRSRHYRARFDSDSMSFMHNALVDVHVPVGADEMIEAVPTVAIQQDTLGQYVYRLETDPEADGFRAYRQDVTTGDRLGDKVVVKSGLDQGVRIATVGAFKLKPGVLVYGSQRGSDNSPTPSVP